MCVSVNQVLHFTVQLATITIKASCGILITSLLEFLFKKEKEASFFVKQELFSRFEIRTYS